MVNREFDDTPPIMLNYFGSDWFNSLKVLQFIFVVRFSNLAMHYTAIILFQIIGKNFEDAVYVNLSKINKF